ncbi:Galactose mutarotase-like superfamily protein isoform 1 [Gossypium australe]|uniref:Galactose mutarotase-like superfamily protein isoform 1 n=1 Tax=Gossypium australe TaxID=47621 RepID=A0A5B6XA41_9ROSI|nr:Galactose mutarotase-like superfamily protein isoform 1 [Gossypium australe]
MILKKEFVIRNFLILLLYCEINKKSQSIVEFNSISSEKLPVELSKGVNGLEETFLREARGSSAEVYLYGRMSMARSCFSSVVRYCLEDICFLVSNVVDMCFLQALFKPSKAIQGGIPICFPQFSNHGPLQSHGFARNRFWSIDPDPPTFPKKFVHYEFRLRVALGLGGDLMLTSRIRNMNTDGKPFTFAFAYHTYFPVSDISEVRVEGLGTLDYLDNLQNKERFTEQGDAITFETEVDRIYLSAPTKITILDHEKKRTFAIRKDGLPDAGEDMNQVYGELKGYTLRT